MTPHEQAVLIERVADDITEAFKPRIREFEREGDRLIGEMNALRRRLADEQRNSEQLRVALGQREHAYTVLAAERERDQRAMLEISAASERWAESGIVMESLYRGETERAGRLASELAAREEVVADLMSERDHQVGLVGQAEAQVADLDLQVAVLRATLQDAEGRCVDLGRLNEELQTGAGDLQASIASLEAERDRHRAVAIEAKTSARDLAERIGSLELEAASLQREAEERARRHEEEASRHQGEYAALLTERDADRLRAIRALAAVANVEQQMAALQAVVGDAKAHELWLERVYATGRRPARHLHHDDAGEQAVICMDLHGTLTPSPGFTAYGQPGAMLPPFPDVRAVLDGWGAQGVCLHLTTGGLDASAVDPLQRAAREVLIAQWVQEYSLPIAFWTGKVSAHAYYDDRMVRVPPGGGWVGVARDAEVVLGKRTELVDGTRRLLQLPEQGTLIEHFPELSEVPPDQPRGLSTPIVDIDIHRCLFTSNTSSRRDRVMPGAREAVRAIYDAGFRVYLSCAGWDPTTKSPQESDERLAGLRQDARTWGITYDEFVTKDHGTVFIDNRGVPFRSWAKDLPVLLRYLRAGVPEDEITPMGPSNA